MKGPIFGLAVAIALVLVLPVVSQGALAQNTDEGQVYSLTISPASPVVFDEITISIGSKNPTSQARDYKLEVIVTKDGEIKSSTPFTFTLKAGSGTFVSPTFKPDDIGEYEVVAKLTDVFGDLKDIKIAKFNVVSEIGPFDISVDTPSKTVTPGTITPILLTLANMGEKATDIQVRVRMDCNSEPARSQDFFVFLYPGAVQDKQVGGFSVCKETGPHELSASIVVFNKTWITAVNEIFLNQSTIQLSFQLPDVITVTAGESKIFDLKVKNEGDVAIDNLKILIPKIPPEWLQVTPASIIQIEPHQEVLFILNITPPRDASQSDATIGISAAADQVLNRKEVELRVVPLKGQSAGQIQLPQGIDLSGIFGNNLTYIGIGGVIAVGGLVGGLRFRRSSSGEDRRRRSEDSDDRLRKVTEALRKRQ